MLRQNLNTFTENASNLQNQAEYLARYNGYVYRYNSAKTKVAALEQDRVRWSARVDAFYCFIQTLSAIEAAPVSFDEEPWQKVIDTVTVKCDGTRVFKFQNGVEMEG